MMRIKQRRGISTGLFLFILAVATDIASQYEQAPRLLRNRLVIIHPVPLKWDRLAQGFERSVLKFEGEGIIEDKKSGKKQIIPRKVEAVAYRIEPSIYKVRVVTALALTGRKIAPLSEIHARTGAVLTINGGFFTKEGDPVGMVISDGQKIANYSEKGGSGIFAVYGKTLRIGWAQNVATATPQPEQAIQNGPLLVEPGGIFGIYHIREKYYHRTAIGLDEQGRLLVLLTKKIYGPDEMKSGLNLYETAAIFHDPISEGGLGAISALNLDGGTSTGMELTLGTHKEKIRVGIQIPNFICVMPQER